MLSFTAGYLIQKSETLKLGKIFQHIQKHILFHRLDNVASNKRKVIWNFYEDSFVENTVKTRRVLLYSKLNGRFFRCSGILKYCEHYNIEPP